MTEMNISELICELNSRYFSSVKLGTSSKAFCTNDLISLCSSSLCCWFMAACPVLRPRIALMDSVKILSLLRSSWVKL